MMDGSIFTEVSGALMFYILNTKCDAVGLGKSLGFMYSTVVKPW
jgi:hypothetical protein